MISGEKTSRQHFLVMAGIWSLEEDELRSSRGAFDTRRLLQAAKHEDYFLTFSA
jgi:hypothetical protein